MRRSRDSLESWPAELQDRIVEAHAAGASETVIAKQFGKTRWLVGKCLAASGVSRRTGADACRRRNLKVSAFDNSEPRTMYWLGMLITDGCLSRINKNGRAIRLSLAERDRSHVYAFREFLGSTHTVYDRAPRWIKDRHGNRRRTSGETSLFVAIPRPMIRVLLRAGITQRKTHSARAGKTQSLSGDFWRGCIDGDGCVSLSRIGNTWIPKVMLCGASRRLLMQFRRFVSTISPECQSTVPRNKCGGVYRVTICNRSAIQLVRALYGDPSAPALTRKMAIATEIIARSNADPRWCVRKGGVPIRCLGKEDEIIALYESGLSEADAGSRFGVSRKVIRRVIRNAGVVMRGWRRTALSRRKSSDSARLRIRRRALTGTNTATNPDTAPAAPESDRAFSIHPASFP